MSNLSEAIMEEALNKIIVKTLQNGKTAEEIAEFNDVDIEVVRAIEEEEKEKICEVVKQLKTEGKMEMLFELVSNGELEIAAAKRASLSEEEFKKLMNNKNK